MMVKVYKEEERNGNKKKNELGKVFHYDLQGKRNFKYDFLKEKRLKEIDWRIN